MEQQKKPSQDPQGAAPGHPCPECGAAREADNTPSCSCGVRAADALRDARTAQAAAAEDFDPLRIRPYVELDGTGEPATPPSATPPSATPLDTTPPSRTPAPGTPASAPAPTPDPDATMTLRAVGTEPPGAATEATSVLPTPLAPSAGPPSAHDLRLFETSAPTGSGPAGPSGPATPVDPGPDGDGGRPPRRRRRGVLLSAAAAVVVVVGAAGFAGGLFSYEAPSRDGALPDEVRASVPDPSTGKASTTPAPSPTSAPPASASPSASASASASPSTSPSTSPSPSASNASPTPSRSAEPTQSTTTTPTADPTEESDGHDQDHDNGSPLHRGDRGPEVAELQQRLTKVYLYTGDIDGTFDQQVEESVRNFQWSRGIRTDELGVYGQATRRQLESETRGR
ncbi:peptidoglycan-binding protein [Streptomyces lancefieldiae]|uniref:Peptidoglycan-binding protein n=1 Tax=Streptomyces lancefieldiae TaxID=3075520 RepID=A0ABU3AP86_9ACTN|nr:peptidoglycan-binding protein [Streptomyces sp. DSM 40712]MDT0611994.1 peptidoglycan-binding protein [Streptomyces sp. DSM 40712]